MLLLLLLLLLLFLFFGFGFSVHALWIVALVALIFVIVSLVTRSGGRRGPWW